MGCKSSKEISDTYSYLARFNEDEQYHVRRVFCSISNCPEEKIISKYFVLHEFLDFVGSNLSDLLAHQLFHGMHDIYKGVTFFGFTKYLSFVFEGNREERGKVFSYLLSQGKNSITKEELVAVLEDISSTLITALPNYAKYQSWNFSNPLPVIPRLSTIFFYDLIGNDVDVMAKLESDLDSINHEDIKRGVTRSSVLSQAISMIINHALQIIHEDVIGFDLPFCSPLDWSTFRTSLDFPSLFLLNNMLPNNLRHNWHLLYSPKVHGESFATLLDRVLSKGPTLIILRDKDGYVFGGFASTSWELKSDYTGTDECFLFKLLPEISIFDSSGSNNNFMFVNTGMNQQTSQPNGLGFGGHTNSFALWIDSELHGGHSSSQCATFNSEMLSGKPRFEIDALEIWGLGPKLFNEDEVIFTSYITKRNISLRVKVGKETPRRVKRTRSERLRSCGGPYTFTKSSQFVKFQLARRRKGKKAYWIATKKRE